jgi:hypothetical protein
MMKFSFNTYYKQHITMSKKINMMDHFDHGKSSNEKAAW